MLAETMATGVDLTATVSTPDSADARPSIPMPTQLGPPVAFSPAVGNGILDPKELDAIKKVRFSPSRPTAARPEPTIPLIADAQVSTQAGPMACRFVNGWAPRFARMFRSALNILLTTGVPEIETIDAGELQDRIGDAWIGMLDSPQPEPEPVMLAIRGPIIEFVAARLLGGEGEDAPADRPSSLVGRHTFSRVGALALSTLARHWQDTYGLRRDPLQDAGEEQRRAFFTQPSLVTATVEIEAPAPGRLVIAAAPALFTTDADQTDALAAPAVGQTPSVLEKVLSDVPLQLSVELGRLALSLREIAERLTPGEVVSLGKPAGEKLDIRLNDHLIARGEAVAVGDRYGIRITDLLTDDQPY